jgi:hypothetical protein
VAHTDDPTEWADQIMHTTKPSRTLCGDGAAASGRVARALRRHGRIETLESSYIVDR